MGDHAQYPILPYAEILSFPRNFSCVDIALVEATDPVIVKNLTKRFGKVTAVHDMSFRIPVGKVVALVGPNGAGKTTLMECIIGAQKPDEGSLCVLGADVSVEPRAMQHRIGVQLQETRLLPKVRVWEYLKLFAGFYEKIGDIDAICNFLGLNEKLNERLGNLSGGWRQRVALALALINDPELLVLDEPTTGFDPIVRREVWDVIDSMRKSGRTILMSTHHMEEAERLADCVLMISGGKLLVAGTPEELRNSVSMKNATLDDVYWAYLRSQS